MRRIHGRISSAAHALGRAPLTHVAAIDSSRSNANRSYGYRVAAVPAARNASVSLASILRHAGHAAWCDATSWPGGAFLGGGVPWPKAYGLTRARRPRYARARCPRHSRAGCPCYSWAGTPMLHRHGRRHGRRRGNDEPVPFPLRSSVRGLPAIDPRRRRLPASPPPRVSASCLPYPVFGPPVFRLRQRQASP